MNRFLSRSIVGAAVVALLSLPAASFAPEGSPVKSNARPSRNWTSAASGA
jgi:hypothetical protein